MIDLDNPFRTRQVAPGVIPYLFSAGESAAALVARLEAQGCWGEITGPHGSGKSTLLATLLPELDRGGWQPLLVTLHDGQRRLSSGEMQGMGTSPRAARVLMVIDGYEQLSYWSRFRLRRWCRKCQHGLLVTAHRPAGFPALHRTIVAPEIAERVVEWLTAGPGGLVAPGEIQGPLAAHGGNLREALFALYDLHERRRTAMHSEASHGASTKLTTGKWWRTETQADGIPLTGAPADRH